MDCEDDKHLWETYITRSIALPPPQIEGEPKPDQAHQVMREQKKCIHCGTIQDLFPKPEDENTKSWELEEEESILKRVTNDPNATYFPKTELVIININGQTKSKLKLSLLNLKN